MSRGFGEKNCILKWQQVAFTFHAPLKKGDHKPEHILPAKVMMDNQAGGENQGPHNDATSQNIWKGYTNLFPMILCGFGFFYEGKKKCLLCHFYYSLIFQLPKRGGVAEKYQAYYEQKKNRDSTN